MPNQEKRNQNTEDTQYNPHNKLPLLQFKIRAFIDGSLFFCGHLRLKATRPQKEDTNCNPCYNPYG